MCCFKYHIGANLLYKQQEKINIVPKVGRGLCGRTIEERDSTAPSLKGLGWQKIGTKSKDSITIFGEYTNFSLPIESHSQGLMALAGEKKQIQKQANRHKTQTCQQHFNRGG